MDLKISIKLLKISWHLLNTVNIQKPDRYGFGMVDSCLVVEWSGFRMKNGRQSIRKPDSKSIQKMNISNPNGPDFGCWLYLYMERYIDKLQIK